MNIRQKIRIWLILPLCLSLAAGCSVGQPASSEPISVSEEERIDPAPLGNTMENICNGGTVATDGEWIYYLHEATQKDKKRSFLWRSRLDSTQAQQITDEYPDQINVVDGWVYFIVNDNLPDERIYKARTDGTEKQVVVQENSIPEKSMIVVKVTYNPVSSGFTTIGKMRTDDTQQQTLIDGPTGSPDILLFNDGWLYFIRDGSGKENAVYKLRADDGSQLTQVGAENSTQAQIHGDWLYWIQGGDYTLHRMRLDGSGIQNYSIRSRCHNPCIFGDWIYLTCGSYPSEFPIRVRLDGSEKQRLP